ncbi:MAG: CarD family transcriptional regulator [Candidatus Babeliaceae bacterium]
MADRSSTFAEYEKVVYPGHGVAQVIRIVEKIVGGAKTTYYELKFINKDGMILVPTAQATTVGMRPLSSIEAVMHVFYILAQPTKLANHYEFNTSNWNKRKKKYQLQLQRGSLSELSEIYRDLRFIETQKELSFGEKNLLTQAETFLVEEISLVQKISKERIMEQLRTLCGKHRLKQKDNNSYEIL